MSATKAVSTLDNVVVKSPNDRRLYRVIELENGLCALLIHDPDIYPEGSVADGQNIDADQIDEDDDDDGEEEDSDGSYEDDEDDEEEGEGDEEDDEDEDEDEVKEKGDHQTKKVFNLRFISCFLTLINNLFLTPLLCVACLRQLQQCVLQWAASWILQKRKAWLTFLVLSSFYQSEFTSFVFFCN